MQMQHAIINKTKIKTRKKFQSIVGVSPIYGGSKLNSRSLSLKIVEKEKIVYLIIALTKSN